MLAICSITFGKGRFPWNGVHVAFGTRLLGIRLRFIEEVLNRVAAFVDSSFSGGFLRDWWCFAFTRCHVHQNVQITHSDSLILDLFRSWSFPLIS